MTREEIVAGIRDLAGPLGPFQSLDDQLERTDGWLRLMGDDAVDQLVSLITDPPSMHELGETESEVFTDVLGEMLCRLATLRPAESVPRLSAHLASDRARPFVADALGSSKSAEAQREIAHYLKENPHLPMSDVLALVEAAAEVGGTGAIAVLSAVRDAVDPGATGQPLCDRINQLLADLP